MEKLNDHIYYQKSSRNIIFTLGFLIGFILMIVFSFYRGFDSNVPYRITAIFLLLTLIMAIIGTINLIKSYRKKEKNCSFRPIILLGNLIILGSFFYVAACLYLTSKYGGF